MLPLAFGWCDLLIANWPTDPAAIDERLPAPLDVQTREGVGWLSVVPFVNVDLRPRGLPAWLGPTVPEVNLRTYVTHDGEPGVYFFSLDAESVAGVLGARLTHRLPYYYARIQFRRTDGCVAVASRRRHPGARAASFEARYRPTGEQFEAEPGSLAAFLAERRRLYTQAQDGTVYHTDVEHEPYPLYDAALELGDATLFDASGFDAPEFGATGFDATDAEPTCYYSPGVDVTTTRSRPHE